MSTKVVRCLRCDGILYFDRERGWVHLQDGGTYMMYCPDCGWQGAPYPSPVRCPNCGSGKVRDDHCAIPRMS